MKILFLTHVLPYPLVGGAKIRAYYILRQLALDHEIMLVSFVRDSDSVDDIEHLRQFCAEVHVIPLKRSRKMDARSLLISFWHKLPAVILRDRQKEFEQTVIDLASQHTFDCIHADQTAMAQFALIGRDAAGSPKPKLILDQHNALFRVVKRQAGYERPIVRLLWRRESNLLRQYEVELCRQFDRILFVSEEDRRLLEDLVIQENGDQDLEKFFTFPICIEPKGKGMVSTLTSERRIIYMGTMFWPPNREGILWFCREVLPLIWEASPETDVHITGRNPSRRIRDLVRLESQEGGHVFVNGFVADLKSLIVDARVFIVPLWAGGGMRVKILDAWSWGIPVVSTSIGAEGIEYRRGEDILIADDPLTFSKCVLSILLDDQLANHLRDYGRQAVEMRYDWRKIYPMLNGVYKALV